MEETSPLVSICMPAYNSANYIAAAINSVINQSYKNLELIIVNDGSTDETFSIANNFDDDRIAVYTTDNRGQCAAANEAFRLSKGKFIKFFDSDDILSENFVEEQIKLIHNKPGCIACASWGRFYGNDLSTFELNANQNDYNQQPFEWLINSMRDGHVMLQCALWLIPRNILLKSGLWNEKLSLINDFDFFIRVLLKAEYLYFSPNSILYYRSGVLDSLSSQVTRKAALSAFTSLTFGIESMLAKDNSIQIKKIAANTFQNFIYDYYPEFPDLINLAEKKVFEYGGSDIKFSTGGIMSVLSRIVGWKMSKRIRKLLKR